MADRDVTDLVKFDINDGEYLPITKCVCGAKFCPWTFMISTYRDIGHVCPKCKRKLYFSLTIKVYEVIEQ